MIALPSPSKRELDLRSQHIQHRAILPGLIPNAAGQPNRSWPPAAVLLQKVSSVL